MADVKYDYKVLLEYEHTGSIAENSVVSTPTVSFGSDEVAQIHRIEIFPPRDSEGNIENLIIQLKVDNKNVNTLFIDSRMLPPFAKDSKRWSIPLGVRHSNNPLENTCPKVKSKFSLTLMGGINGVTGDFKIRVLGDYFGSEEALIKFFGPVYNPTPVHIIDEFRNKKITVHNPVNVSIDNFDILPGGGMNAEKPFVMPLVIHNWNKNATTANKPYDFSKDNVVYEDYALDYDLDETECYIFDYIGVIPHANSKYAYFKIGTVEYPRGYWDVSDLTNMLPLGTVDDYQGPRKIERKPIIHDEKATFYVVDNGTSIPAKSFMVGLWGRYIVLK